MFSGFTIPSLPKEDYEFVCRVRDQYRVTQRDVILAALGALRHLAQVDRARVDAMLTPAGASRDAFTARTLPTETQGPA